jgi:hypothetical protein
MNLIARLRAAGIHQVHVGDLDMVLALLVPVTSSRRASDNLVSQMGRIAQDWHFVDAWMKSYGDEIHDYIKEGKDEAERHDRADTEVREQFERFASEFYDKHEMSSDNRLMVWRCISVEDVDAAIRALEKGEPLTKDHKGLGIYWSWDHKAADCHLGKHPQNIIIEAEVDTSSINLEETTKANISDENEHEITLDVGSSIYVLGAWKKGGGNLLDVSNDPVEYRA